MEQTMDSTLISFDEDDGYGAVELDETGSVDNVIHPKSNESTDQIAEVSPKAKEVLPPSNLQSASASHVRTSQIEREEATEIDAPISPPELVIPSEEAISIATIEPTTPPQEQVSPNIPLSLTIDASAPPTVVEETTNAVRIAQQSPKQIEVSPTASETRQQGQTLANLHLDLADLAIHSNNTSFVSSGRRSAISIATNSQQMYESPKQKLSPVYVDVPSSPRRSSKTSSIQSPTSDCAHDWMVCRAETGDIYYYNTKRQVSQWTLPPELAQEKVEADTLHVATSNGDLHRVSELISAGLPVNGVDDEGRTALWYALENIEIARMLLAHSDSSLNKLDHQGTSLLHLVTRQRNIEILSLLLAHGINVDVRDKANQTALHVAATFGFRKCVEMLLDHGASPAVLDGSSQTPIMLATLGNHIGCVQILQVALAAKLQAAEIESNKSMKEAYTIDQLQRQLSSAARELNDTQRAYELLEGEMMQLRHDAAQHTQSMNALETAYRIANSRIAMLEALGKRTSEEHAIEREAWQVKEAHFHEELESYMGALKNLQADVEIVMSSHRPIDIEEIQRSHEHPLNSPGKRSRMSNTMTEEILFDRGDDLNDEETTGQEIYENQYQENEPQQSIPQNRVDAIWGQFFMNASKSTHPITLMQSVLDANLEQVNTLLASGHSPNLRDRLQRTPMHLVSDRGDVEMLALLFEYMGDIEARDGKGNTPLHVACFRGHFPCVKFLLESAADVFAVNEDGDSVVHATAFSGSLSCLKIVLEYGATPFGRNLQGETAYDMLLERDGPVANLLDLLQTVMTESTPPPTKRPIRTPLPPTQVASYEELDEFVSPPSSPLPPAAPVQVNIYDRENDADDEDDEGSKNPHGMTPDGWGGWIRVTASSMLGLHRGKSEKDVVVDDPSSPLKPPTDAQVLTTTKYHDLVPPSHVYEAMMHLRDKPIQHNALLETPQDIVHAMEQNATKPQTNRYAMSSQGTPKSMQRATSRYVDTFHT